LRTKPFLTLKLTPYGIDGLLGPRPGKSPDVSGQHAPVTGLQGSTVVSGFPQVVASDWCGEYGRANG